ncbi:MAG: histidine kinase [Thermaerobacter sp.]|nr:histidine kinase [Thermaerobacter sp.]
MGEPVSPLDIALAIRAARGYWAGLTRETAERIARIVLGVAHVQAVAITDSARILAYEGAGCPYMRPGQPVQTKATRQVLRTGEVALIERKQDLHCPIAGCPCAVQAAVIAPLKVQGEVVGTVKLYAEHPGPMPGYATRLAIGISELLSLQAELSEVERQKELLAQARLEALQAQIRPHFLFNTLNTVIATSRFDPDLARELLTELAAFLRHTISYRGEKIRAVEELAFVHQYLRLEQARFGDRIAVRLQMEQGVETALIPVLALQPLVENAIVHGLAPKDGHGQLLVSLRRRGVELQMAVVDDGVGITRARLRRLFLPHEGTGMGLGIANVHERLHALYGSRGQIRLRSRPGRGTVVLVRLPFELPEED